VIQRIANARQSTRAALDRYTLVLAQVSLAELRHIIEVEGYVIGDEEIQFAVIVVINESRARGPAWIAHSSHLSNISESPIAVVLEQVIGPDARNV
jgi:hypothetical protein